MLFKMILDNSGDEERPIVRGFLKHLIAGFAAGLMVGAVGLFLACSSARRSGPAETRPRRLTPQILPSSLARL